MIDLLPTHNKNNEVGELCHPFYYMPFLNIPSFLNVSLFVSLLFSRQYVTLEILSCTCVEFVAFMGEYGLDVPFYPLYFVAMQIMRMEI